MAEYQPGLAPRKLDADIQSEVVTNRELQEPAMTTDSTTPDVKEEASTQVSDNTEATEKAEVGNEQFDTREQQPVSDRAERRYQELANARREAEEHARRAEEQARRAEDMLSRIIGSQPTQPALSEEESLAKAYTSYDPKLGYPTDPREYSQYNANLAAIRARQETQKVNRETSEQQEINALMKSYPDADDALLGAIAAERSAAQRKGLNLTYKEAADRVTEKLEKRYSKKLSEQVARDTQMKNEAYVETTKGASSTRSAKVDPNTMSVEDMEKWLKENGTW